MIISECHFALLFYTFCTNVRANRPFSQDRQIISTIIRFSWVSASRAHVHVHRPYLFRTVILLHTTFLRFNIRVLFFFCSHRICLRKISHFITVIFCRILNSWTHEIMLKLKSLLLFTRRQVRSNTIGAVFASEVIFLFSCSRFFFHSLIVVGGGRVLIVCSGNLLAKI